MANNKFGLTLDTLAPTGSITRTTPQYVNGQSTFAINKGDATYMYVWLSKGTPDSALPESGVTWAPAAESISLTPSENGNFYANLVLMDDVSNKSAVYHSEVVTYDTAKPTVKITTYPTLTNKHENSITFTMSDPLPSSGMAKYSISGDCVAISDKAFTDAEKSAGQVTVTVTLNHNPHPSEDIAKNVTVTVYDNAGNYASNTCTITLDDQALENTLVVTGAGTIHKGENLSGHWVNERPISAKISVSGAEWAGYKLYGDFATTAEGSATAEPAGYTNVTAEEIAAKTKTINGLHLTGGDGDKVIRLKTIDKAGNVSAETTVTIKADYSAPTVSLVANKVYVSNIAGHNSVVVTPTVNANNAGMDADHATYQWYVGDQAITNTQVAGATADKAMPADLTIPASLLGSETPNQEKTAKTIKLKIKDSAGNEATSAPVTVYVDTKAPVGAITVDAWYNGADGEHTTYTAWGQETFRTSISDAGAGLASYKAWVSEKADDAAAKGTSQNITSNNFSIEHGKIDLSGLSAADGTTRYLHVQVVDKVGNTSIIHSHKFGIDTTAPTGLALSFKYPAGYTAYKTTAAELTLSADGSVSGLYQVKLFGDYTKGSATQTESAAAWEAWGELKNLTLVTGSGTKTVKAYVKDNAHNVTAVAVSASCELDMDAPNAQFWAYNAENTGEIASTTPQQQFYIRLTGNEDGGSTAKASDLKYKIWGDFNKDQATASAKTATPKPDKFTAVGKWNTNTPTSAAGTNDALLIGPLYLTSPDGAKTVYIEVEDNAGNTYELHKQITTYDTSAPEVNVSNLDHNRISKVHELRQATQESSGATIDKTTHTTNHYADEVTYIITPSEPIKAWKTEVVVDEKKQAIGTAGGSSNMAGSVRDSGAAINCMIRGADYEAAIQAAKGVEAGTNVDGSYVVIVSVQDLGGTWSEYGSLTL